MKKAKDIAIFYVPLLAVMGVSILFFTAINLIRFTIKTYKS